MKTSIKILVVALGTLFLSLGLQAQDYTGSNEKGYMTMIVKGRQYYDVYITSTVKGFEKKEIGKSAFYDYTVILDMIKEFEGEGWELIETDFTMSMTAQKTEPVVFYMFKR